MIRSLLFPDFSPRRGLWLAAAAVCAALGRAAEPNYADEPLLAATPVLLVASEPRPLSLAELFALVELQTGFHIANETSRLLGETTVTVGGEGALSLARLLSLVAAQAGVRFSLDGRTLVMREVAGSRPEAVAGRAAVVPPAMLSPGLAADAAGVSLDAEIAAIVRSGLSPARQDRRIAEAVRSALTLALAGRRNSAEMVGIAAELARAAAGAAPKFANTVANTLAFAPQISRLPAGAARVRAAAFDGARRPGARVALADRSAVASAAVDTAALPVARPAFYAAPATETSSVAEPMTVATAPTASAEIGQGAADAAPERTALAETSAPAPNPEPPVAAASVFAGAGLQPLATAASEPAPAPSGGVVQMERFGVSDTVVKGGSADLRSERTRAAVAIDTLSADQLLKYSASDLSDVVFRIPGVSVANGQFAVVRGLSDRFLSTTLQGVKIPSPDPEKQAVQLDLIPASAVEAVVVAKSFEPGQWAESAGGNMDIRTRAIPGEPLTKVTVDLKLNSNAAKGGPDYRINGSRDERFGFGSRSRPAAGVNEPNWQYSPTMRGRLPAGSKIGFEFAREFAFGERKLGLLLSVFNDASYKAESGRKAPRFAIRGEAPRAATTNPARPATVGKPSDFELVSPRPTSPGAIYLYNESESEFVSAATLAAGFRFSENHELKLSTVVVQVGNDQSQIGETELTKDPVTGATALVGTSPRLNFEPIYTWFRNYEYFRERNLTLVQLSGRHRFGGPTGFGATWAAQRSSASQKDHPFIETVFNSPFSALYKNYVVLAGSDAPTPITALWAETQETQQAGRLDFEWPFRLWGSEDAKLAFGSALDASEREVAASGIFAQPRTPLQGADPNAILSTASRTIGGRFPSSNAAEREILAYYAGLTLPIAPWLKLTGGARFEDFSFLINGSGRWGNYSTSTLYDNRPGGGQFGNLLGTTSAASTSFTSREWYPAAGLTFQPLKSLTLRLGHSQTNGRPSFREVTPFFNKSVETGNLVVGNPALVPSEVKSDDLRLEWAPNRHHLVSVSAFRKSIAKPIEKILLDTSAVAAELTEIWVNNPGTGELRGFEFEFKHRLDFWAEALRNFSVSGNVTYIEAEVPENPLVINLVARPFFQNPAKIPASRRLFDQPEYIGNLEFTWSDPRLGTTVTFSAYAISDTLSVAGLSSFSFDVYERAYVRYDLVFNQQITARLRLKLSLKNLTDSERGSVYDRDATSELIVRNSYKAGREYGLSLSTTF